MGVIIHKTVVVTSIEESAIKEARDKALSIYEECYPGSEILISGIVPSLMNGFRSFFIAPHGSSAGWKIETQCTKAQEIFIDWMTEHGELLEFDELSFGDDLYR